VTFGTAGALGLGSLMRAAGIDWRTDFALAAILAASALVALPAGLQGGISSGSILALIRQKGGRRRALRLELLFVATLGVPFVVGAKFSPRC